MTLRVEWDQARAIVNLKKHGVPFGEALGMFLDPDRIDRYMDRDACFLTVGQTHARPLTILYAIHGRIIRIISARKASRHELRSYWENRQDHAQVGQPAEPAHAPRMSEATKTRLDRLSFEDIDFSDIPDSPEHAGWMCPGPLVPQAKTQVTLDIDHDVLEYFRHAGKDYQTQINCVLRAYMHAQKDT